MLRKSLLLGGGGTLAYCGLVAVAAFALQKPELNRAILNDPVALLALLPLIPGLLPGLLVIGAMAHFGAVGPIGTYEGAFLLAPFVNSAWVWLWLRRRSRQQSDCCG